MIAFRFNSSTARSLVLGLLVFLSGFVARGQIHLQFGSPTGAAARVTWNSDQDQSYALFQFSGLGDTNEVQVQTVIATSMVSHVDIELAESAVSFFRVDLAIPSSDDVMVILEGDFEMGADVDGSPTAGFVRRHTVFLSEYEIGKFEVTHLEAAEVYNWALVNVPGLVTVDTNTVRGVLSAWRFLILDDVDSKISWDGTHLVVDAGWEDRPCAFVSWYGAAAYCNFKSEMEGLEPCFNLQDWSCDFTKKGWRLPTEAEWEKALRGGREGLKYPWGNDLADGSMNIDHHRPGTVDVGSYPTYGGLHDMVGNVWEYCYDKYYDFYYDISPRANPTGALTSVGRCRRGGSWRTPTGWATCYARGAHVAHSWNDDAGFRIARYR